MSMCEWCRNKDECHQPAWVNKAVENNDLYCVGFKASQMPRISMNRTTSSFVTENKTVTRRSWQPVTIKRFKKDTKFLAVQRCYGGEALGIGQLTEDPYKQLIDDVGRDMNTISALYGREGFCHLDFEYEKIMAKQNIYLVSKPLKDATYRWVNSGNTFTVVPFKILEVFPDMKEKYSTDEEIVRCVKALVKVIG